MSKFDHARFRAQFPLIGESRLNPNLVYFDNGATTQKPSAVLEAESSFYSNNNSNVHRASFSLAATATELFEGCRTKLSRFFNTQHVNEIIFTKGATESINLVAFSWGQKYLSQGDEIVLSAAEHHANIVPWQIIAEQTGAVIKWAELLPNGRVDLEHFESLLSKKTKMVAINHISNVLGVINPIQEIAALAKQVGAYVLIDGAQSAAAIDVDVQALGIDFYVCSSHKMYGPTGVGVLYGRKDILESMNPYQTGGEMIAKVTREGTKFNKLPFKFEAGTPNIAGVVAFTQALTFIEQFGLRTLSYKNELIEYAYAKLSGISGLSFLIEGKPDLPIFSFILPQHLQDIAAMLDSKGIAIRAGSLCAMPLMQSKNIDGCIRVSLAPYNTFEEIDYLIKSLESAIASEQGSAPSSFEKNDVDTQEVLMRDKFKSASSWDLKQREIMLLGKSFTRMGKEKRVDQYLVQGCESKAWVIVNENSGSYSFEGDSDARIIRGLLAIVFAAFQGKTKQEILAFDIKEYFDSLGLIKHLSPSRGNGLNAIVAYISEKLTS